MSKSLEEFGRVYLLDGKGGGRLIDKDRWNSPKHAEEVLWVHMDLTSEAAQQWLREESGVAEIGIAALLEVESRPRLTVIDSAALLAFRGVNCHPGADPDDMVGIRVWMDRNRIITSYRRELYSIRDIEDALGLGKGPASVPEFLCELVERLVSRLSETISNLGELIDELEDELIEGQLRELRVPLSALRRQIIALRRYLAPQRDAMTGLLVSKLGWLEEDHRMALRRTFDNLLRQLEDLEAIRERASLTQEELQSRLAEQQNVRVYVLSVVTAIFLPLGFLTGLLGVNVGGMPGTENSSAFWILVAALVLLVGAEVFLFRLRKWF